MPRSDFLHVTTWIFDLDNTLYPPDLRLFDQIERLMTDYVMRALNVGRAEADHLRDSYWRLHGTTLAGLMREHGLDPDPYLAAVHDIDLTMVAEAVALRAAITALRGRKIVYTNGSREHARRVTAALGLAQVFDALYGIEDARYLPKPGGEAFDAIFALDRIEAGRAAMFEDDPRNLQIPHARGLRTILVTPPGASLDHHAHVHHRTDDLAAFLAAIA